ncbi:hypothetical protein [Hathewaya limosa]|uniref:Stage 0 sporulation protein A homolog n=1 Tax=Hathewaya limosa TaxID=1536 RepID=A0ABU0JRN7_HATLI|nr:hypothetical protein [Hathewaya limosa]MDQ0479749.1 hypothetical protein [Hathewaya limosa]
MYNIGLIDDEYEQLKRYQKRFKSINKDIVISSVEGCHTCEDVVQWILNNRIECLLVDYKLVNKFSFTGAELINCINNKIGDLPCVILTSHKEDAEDEKLVLKLLIFDKELIGKERTSSELQEFIAMIIHAIEVFRKRFQLKKERYEALLQKAQKDVLNFKEKEQLEDLFKALRSYDIIDDVSVVSINKQVEDKVDNLINKIDELLNK